MQEFTQGVLNWLLANLQFVVFTIISLVIVILQAVISKKTNVEYSDFKKAFEEVNEMYKTESSFKTTAQEFDSKKSQYRLNKATNTLVELEEKIDIDKLVESALETALDRILNRMSSPLQQQIEEEEMIYNEMSDRLDTMREMYDWKKSFAAEHGLDEDVSDVDFWKYVNTVQVSANNKIKELQGQVSAIEEAGEQAFNDSIQNMEVNNNA